MTHWRKEKSAGLVRLIFICIVADETPKEECGESTKQRIEREFKEMAECKKPRDKDDRCKSYVARRESKTTCADNASKTCDKSKKDNTRNCRATTGKLKSVMNKLSFLRGSGADESPIIVRLIPSLFVSFLVVANEN